MMTYVPIHASEQIIRGGSSSPTIVITGWTVKEAIAKKLSPDTYAALGQLYSPTRGLSFLIRNLLANPFIRYIVVLGATREDENSGSVRCLIDFFGKGVKEGVNDAGARCWEVLSDVVGYIDGEIPLEAIELVRRSLSVFRAEDVKGLVALVEMVQGWEKPNPIEWAKATQYPLAEIVSDVKPCSPFGHKVEGDTVAECWLEILKRVRSNGGFRPTGYGGQVQELINLVAVVNDEPEVLYIPPYLPFSREFIENGYLAQVLEDNKYQGEGVKYTYGERIRSHFKTDQVAEVIAKLRGEIDSASAVILLWDKHIDNIKSGSPCLNHIWVKVVGGKLTLTATLRSNDMFSAWPANAMALRKLQILIRDGVDPSLALGALVTISLSAHVYADCLSAADKIVRDHYQPPTFKDPVGNFCIEWAGGVVTVTQTTPRSGSVVATYAGIEALRLIRGVVEANPSIRPDHAAYLGLEIGAALRGGGGYRQDRVYKGVTT